MTPELKAKTSQPGTTLQTGHLSARVEPVYPQDAERQGIAGTVKLRILIGRDGTVQSVQVVNGPAGLAPASVNAISQWRYQPTLVGGQPVETEQDITVVFSLSNPVAPSR